MHRPPIPPSSVSVSMAIKPPMSTTNPTPTASTPETKMLIWFPNYKACGENPIEKKLFKVMV
jgi:hypothetical protein